MVQRKNLFRIRANNHLKINLILIYRVFLCKNVYNKNVYNKIIELFYILIEKIYL